MSLYDPAPIPVAGADSYASIGEADALAGKRAGAEVWREAFERAALAAAENDEAPPPPPAECCRALFTATAILDGLNWAGVRTDDAQALAWPRRGVKDAQRRPLPIDYIPPALATACAELAFYLLSTDQAPRRAPVQMIQVGAAMEMYFPSVADELPKHVRRMVEPYLAVRSSHSAELLF